MKTFAKNLLATIFTFTFFAPVWAQVQLYPMSINSPANSAELNAIATQLVESVVTGNLQKTEALLSNDFMIYFSGGDSLTKEGFIKMWKGYHADATGHSFTNGEVVAVSVKEGPSAGDWALVWGLTQWTPNTTQSTIYSYVHLSIQIKKGKVTRCYQFQDQLPIVMQLGYQLIPPATASKE
ncbi:MAG: nuclear transport factor 2 family protein [Bacteroidia bacterium]|nr:nuclear transport factor 2 family protein [Bacteroidia bacterium]